MEMQPTSNTTVKGKPVDTAMACKAMSPPPNNSAMASTPSSTAQNTRCDTGALILPPAVMVSITSEPESDEVMKNIMTSTTPRKEEMEANGYWPSMVNNWSSRAAS